MYWKQKQNESCTWILQPSSYETPPAKATNIIRLGRSYGSVLEFKSTDPATSGAILFCHGCQGNATKYDSFIQQLLTQYSTVYVLEPRGFGVVQGTTTLTAIILSIRNAWTKLSAMEHSLSLATQGLGSNLALFAMTTFSLSKPSRCHIFSYLDWNTMIKSHPFLDHCTTGVLSQWNKLLSAFSLSMNHLQDARE